MKLHKKHTLKGHECHSVTCLKRHKYHRLIHKLHHKHRLSYKTLFYMKEYGPKSHVTSVIVKESLKMLILASVLSSLGGIYIKSVQNEIITVLPLLVLLPALTDMIGDFGTIVSSKFTTMLYLGKVKKEWWSSENVHELIYVVLSVATISAFYIGALAYLIAYIKGFAFTYLTFLKVIGISLVATMSLIGIIITISILGGIWIFKKKEDPNNFLIPITTSVADFGSLILFSAMDLLLF